MTGTPVPRAAAVVLLREAAGGAAPCEVYMVRRPAGARFAPGAYIFPGGVLEARDRVGAATLLEGPGDSRATALHARMAGAGPFASPDPLTSASLLVCAARELFEEAGVLPARDAAGAPAAMTDRRRWRGLREALLAGRLPFDRLLRDEGLDLSTDDLLYFSHWITPEASRLRFDTRFFLATLPPGQEASHHAGELDGGMWIAPREGLARHARGDFPLLPVQTHHLARFAAFDSLAALLTFARRKAAPAVLPALDTRTGGVTLPEEIARCW